MRELPIWGSGSRSSSFSVAGLGGGGAWDFALAGNGAGVHVQCGITHLKQGSTGLAIILSPESPYRMVV